MIRSASVTVMTALLAGVLGGCVADDLSELSRTFQEQTAGDAARGTFDWDDPDNRRSGIVLLSNATFGGTEVYVRRYRDSVEHEDNPIVRAVAIRALARHGTVEDATLIARFLDRATIPNHNVRWESAKGLQRIHDPAVVPVLLGALHDPDERPEVRAAGALALGQYAEDRVVQGLMAALDALPLSVNRSAQASLQTLTGQDFDLDRWTWQAWYDEAMTHDSAFEERRPYLYRTYRRDETWLDRVAFWRPRSWEHPGPPTGLPAAQVRSTYEDPGERSE